MPSIGVLSTGVEEEWQHKKAFCEELELPQTAQKPCPVMLHPQHVWEQLGPLFVYQEDIYWSRYIKQQVFAPVK